MIIKNEKCIISNSECNYTSTCRYLLERFGVFECEPVEYKKPLVEAVHQKELQERANLKIWSERKAHLIK